MTIIQSILLGILQGIAEFLPISSSGHLAVAQYLFGLEDIPLLFDVFLHLATLLAVVIYFRKTILDLLCVFGRWITLKKADEAEQDKRRYIIAVIITTFITAVLGLLSSKFIPELGVRIICMGFLVTAILLILSSAADRNNIKKAGGEMKEKAPNILQAVVIGIAQGIGTLPGISRSGATISGALFSNVDRKTAGEYSFIVSIPAILGAFILELKDMDKVSGTIGAAPVIAGCIAAFVAGYASLVWLMKIIKKGNLKYFAAYLVIISALCNAYINFFR